MGINVRDISILGIGALAMCMLASTSSYALQTVIDGPSGSGHFGNQVLRLPNANFVVSDPEFDLSASIQNAGAVYLYNPQGQLISTLTGTQNGEQVGFRLWLLPNGDVLVHGQGSGGYSLTKLDKNVGLNGTVGSTNSLLGATGGDLSLVNVAPLSNGKVVLGIASLDSGGLQNVGAAMLWDPATALPTAVNQSNALLGSFAGDFVGLEDAVALSNGNYVVVCRNCDGGLGNPDVGAVVFGRGDIGRVGRVAFSNSFVGPASVVPERFPGQRGYVLPLPNGHYVVVAPDVDTEFEGELQTDGGAVTWVNGNTGLAGASPRASNSLIGLFRGPTAGSDQVGLAGVTVLSNGNYVVASPRWGAADEGAVTWASGTTGRVGVVDTSNSLYGTSISSLVGSGGVLGEQGSGVIALANGNYVVSSPRWGTASGSSAGAATWGNGSVGSVGPVSATNSLVGLNGGDSVGANILALRNGNYVVGSPQWLNPITKRRVGAATFALGNGSTLGAITASNSLVGARDNDQVGASLRSLNEPGEFFSDVPVRRERSPSALAEGSIRSSGNPNYLVVSPTFDLPLGGDVGAVTWGSGVTGVVGTVSASNSMIGSSTGDYLGDCTLVLANGNYVALAAGFDLGILPNVGAAFFGSGTTSSIGTISTVNSAYGQVANNALESTCYSRNVLGNGHDFLRGAFSDNRGSLTWVNGNSGLVGPINASNSLVGSLPEHFLRVSSILDDNWVALSSDGYSTSAPFVSLVSGNAPLLGTPAPANTVTVNTLQTLYATAQSYDLTRRQLIVQQPQANRVILLQPGAATTMTNLQSSANPAVLDQVVTFSVQVISANAPSDGQVTFQSDRGEQCIDTTPIAISPTISTFSCTMRFSFPGLRQVRANYFGSELFAATSINAIAQNVLGGDVLFKNGFELLPKFMIL